MSQIILLIVTIVVLVRVLQLRAVLAKQFPLLRARAVPPGAAFPPAHSDLFELAHAELTALGFEGPTGFLIDAEPATAATVRFQVAYRKPAEGTLCWLFPSVDPRRPNRLGCYLATRLADGRTAISQADDVFFELMATPEAPARSVFAATLGRQWEGHRDWLAGFGVGTDDSCLDPAALQDFAGEWHNRQRDRLIELGRLWRDSGGVVRARFGFALRMLYRFATRPKVPPDLSPTPPARLAGLAGVIERVRAAEPTRAAQWCLFGVSLLLFAVLGAAIWDLRVALLLMLVIFVHELGHYLAMRAFGYRNVHMLALPLVGGVTIGQETHPSAARRAWMSLMGPLPGIVIGWILLVATRWVPDAAAWGPGLQQAALMFLAVNYLNIVPVPPLDGAHVVQAMLPPRWYAVQAAFLLLACIAGAVGATLAGYVGLAVIALLQLISVPAVIQNGRALRELLRGGVPDRSQSRVLRLKRVFEVLETTSGPARQASARINQAEAVLRAADQAPMSWWQRGILGSVMLALLAVPLAGVVFYVALGREFAPPPSGASAQRWSAQLQEMQELRLRAQGMSTAQLIAQLDAHPAAPAESAALEAAQQRLGFELPAELREIYALANGVQAIGLVAVEKIGSASVERLDELAEGGNLAVQRSDSETAVSQPVAVARARQWLRIGDDDAHAEQLFYDAAAIPALDAARVIESIDGELLAYPDLRSRLVETWVGLRSGERMQVRRDAAEDTARGQLKDVPVAALLDEFEAPGLLLRSVLQQAAWPAPADPLVLADAARRLQRELPADLIAVYRRHNGFPPIQLIAAEHLSRLGDRPPGSEQERLTWSASLPREFVERGADGAVGAALRIDSAQMQDCVVVAAYSYPNATPDQRAANSARFGPPNGLWCPAGDGAAERWIAVGSGRIFPSFRSYLLDAAARRRAQKRMLTPD